MSPGAGGRKGTHHRCIHSLKDAEGSGVPGREGKGRPNLKYNACSDHHRLSLRWFKFEKKGKLGWNMWLCDCCAGHGNKVWLPNRYIDMETHCKGKKSEENIDHLINNRPYQSLFLRLKGICTRSQAWCHALSWSVRVRCEPGCCRGGACVTFPFEPSIPIFYEYIFIHGQPWHRECRLLGMHVVG